MYLVSSVQHTKAPGLGESLSYPARRVDRHKIGVQRRETQWRFEGLWRQSQQLICLHISHTGCVARFPGQSFGAK